MLCENRNDPRCGMASGARRCGVSRYGRAGRLRVKPRQDRKPLDIKIVKSQGHLPGLHAGTNGAGYVQGIQEAGFRLQIDLDGIGRQGQAGIDRVKGNAPDRAQAFTVRRFFCDSDFIMTRVTIGCCLGAEACTGCLHHLREGL